MERITGLEMIINVVGTIEDLLDTEVNIYNIAQMEEALEILAYVDDIYASRSIGNASLYSKEISILARWLEHLEEINEDTDKYYIL